MAINYGRCMTGMNRLDLRGRLTRGLESVIQDTYHALITVRGTLPSDPEAGLGLIDRILDAGDIGEQPALGSDIEAELQKDDRIASSEATVTPDPSGLVVIDLVVTTAAGPTFRLVGPIASVRTEILYNG